MKGFGELFGRDFLRVGEIDLILRLNSAGQRGCLTVRLTAFCHLDMMHSAI
jgi:hypothetical protein